MALKPFLRPFIRNKYKEREGAGILHSAGEVSSSYPTLESEHILVGSKLDHEFFFLFEFFSFPVPSEEVSGGEEEVVIDGVFFARIVKLACWLCG